MTKCKKKQLNKKFGLMPNIISKQKLIGESLEIKLKRLKDHNNLLYQIEDLLLMEDKESLIYRLIKMLKFYSTKNLKKYCKDNFDESFFLKSKNEHNTAT